MWWEIQIKAHLNVWFLIPHLTKGEKGWIGFRLLCLTFWYEKKKAKGTIGFNNNNNKR